MSELPAEAAGTHDAGTGKERRGIFARIALFVRQVVGELRKVVTPTRSELINYTIVVIVFVTVAMLFVTGLDLVVGQGAGWLFGN
ncbi:preprotein translocase subunit SecE [Isoptericola sp. CG 20/1183]|uniref:Protein translocase subunit SecE n=1 Tax=Isoptericola halotolerans TaxID=300560 RepID=A0ABX5EEG3_9MICO|nr:MULTISPECIES: preprotein translocase subunit SecE [Isoptericola]MCK0118503.1 preprotein translocase subunit SecE [Isoptericola sp. S6320L]PRZ07087.1 preprotein translocase subunit SecE [Isoptericola halotolerans]PRZ07241.1 preprotein translocase subunit SecE [Isoptericola sp. CG 20/1183]